MSVLDATDCFRPQPGIGGWLATRLFAAAPAVLAAARRVWPIAGGGGFRIVTRDDDVRAVFADDAAFGVPYAANLAVITGGKPFFLGLGDTPQYRAQLAAARAVVRAADLPRLGDAAEACAAGIVAAAGGTIDVVALVRRVAFEVIGGYFGVPEPPRGSLAVWGSRLFEYQFLGGPGDAAWRADIEVLAAAMRAHVDTAIATRKAAGGGPDDVLGRCLAAQAAGTPGFDDIAIRTMLTCMVVGGPPQPPMVVPQGVEQLLRRPEWLAAAGTAARGGDDTRLAAILTEAMRFDPLAPGLQRIALADRIIAAGTTRETTVRRGATVFVSFASAMMDPRRVAEARRFDPGRLPRDYLHFGQGLHECFGRAINAATLHRMVQPLLARPNLRRAAGPAGRLRKAGLFPERLVVAFD